MTDPTEGIRRVLTSAINQEAADIAEKEADPRAELEARYGQLWDTKEMTSEFAVQSFAAPFVVVTRRSDSQRGTLMFSHSPRFYHSFTPEG